MDAFHERNNETFCEDLALSALAKEVGTPCYVYSKASILNQCQQIISAFSTWPTLPCYAVKANGNLSILKEIFKTGFGADTVSLGEIERALKAGVDPKKVVYSGVGKRADEIIAALRIGILSFNVESAGELELIASLAAERGLVAPVTLRVNPNIDAKTNPKITTGLYSSKFGLIEAEAKALADRVRQLPSLKLVGVGCHIGSQIVDVGPLKEASVRLTQFAGGLRELGHKLDFVDLGGGLGIRYKNEVPPAMDDYAKAVLEAVKPTGLKLLIEPGRVVMGNTGILLCSVLNTKQTPEKNFLIVDGAMNDLVRPTMYDSYHEIKAVKTDRRALQKVDVVGPICETGDYFGKDRELPACAPGDLVYLCSSGAYASSMASNYNTRPRAPEILVDGSDFRVIRRRETLEDLWQLEL